MLEQPQQSFFIWDTHDGNVAVEATPPGSDSKIWPVQILRLDGPGPVGAPSSPMAPDEFSAWRADLEKAGYKVDIRYK
jgi:hypothetical protein